MAVRSLPMSIFVCLIERTTDLHVGNILFHSPSIASWSSHEEVYQYLEPPCRYNVHQGEKKEPGPLSPHVPEYIVGTPDPTSLLKLCLSDPTQLNIRICDFSEAFIYIPGINRKVYTPAVYAAPEILLDDCPSPASDVWAFAVLFNFLLTCCHIFPSVQFRDQSNEVLRHMVVVQSKLPERLWLKWADRGQYFDDNAQWVADPEKFPHRLVGRMFSIRSDRMDAAEQEIFKSMLWRMVAYEPKERPTMTEVVDLISDTWSKSLPHCARLSVRFAQR
jgi:serine/threonine-protein kinase SRPK3